MLDRLLDYYKSNVRVYSLVFIHFRLKYGLFVLTVITTLISIPFLVPSFFIKNLSVLSMSSLALLLVASGLMFLVVNHDAKKIIRKRYGIVVENFLWRTRKFEEYQSEQLKDYLKKNHIFTPAKIRLLIELLNKDGERRKISPFIKPGLFLALFIPIWVRFVDYFFKEIQSQELALATLITLSLFVYIITYLFGVSKSVMDDFKDTFFKDDNSLIKDLISFLEELLLLLPEER